jgi:O-antigen/teichoic acid export membrane protein
MSSAPSIKKLAGETVIYGLSSVVGRAVSFLLLPIYTAVFSTTEYGIQSLVYVYAAVLFVFYVLRFDTAYFRFASDEKWKSTSFETAFTGVGLVSLVISAMMFIGTPWIADVLFNISDQYHYIIKLLALILFFDALAEIPYARLRLENKALRFATIRLTNIFINIGLNCFFLLFIPWYLKTNPDTTLFSWYYFNIGIGYIFISNLVASLISFILLFPQWKSIRLNIDRNLMRQMWSYAAPLVVVALAGIINEMIDRAMLDRLLPFDDATNKAQAGIYSAAYKFSILISLFIQAYRYAAEPFFFKHADHKKSPMLYAKAAEYFVLAACLGFLCIMFYLPYLKQLMRNTDYHEGVVVVPILIMANIFLGIYYNLSVWYKLTDKTRYAMYIALGGAVITLLLNFALIPIWGYLGSAWATLVCYGCMTFASYFIGRRHYTLEHSMIRMLSYMLMAVLIYYGGKYAIDQLVQTMILRDICYGVVILLVSAVIYKSLSKG